MELTASDYYILLFLKENPFSQLTELAQALDVSPNTVKARISRLKETGVIRGDGTEVDPVLGNRRVTETVVYPSYSSLGLKTVVVIFLGIKDKSSLLTLYQYLNQHPYTVYRGFGFSAQAMVYAQFAIPPDPANYLGKFLQVIQERGLCEKTYMFPYATYVTSRDQLDFWDHHLKKWRYEVSSLSFESPSSPIEEPPKANFNFLDLVLLRELTINAKVRVKELTGYHRYDRSTLSRHLKFVKENLVRSYGILYNRRLFDISNYRLFWGEFDGLSPLNDLVDERFPFTSSFATEGDKFIWMVHAPDYILNDLSQVLFQRCKSLYQAILYPETGFRYYFYHENYDQEKRQWRYSEEYLLNID